MDKQRLDFRLDGETNSQPSKVKPGVLRQYMIYGDRYGSKLKNHKKGTRSRIPCAVGSFLTAVLIKVCEGLLSYQAQAVILIYHSLRLSLPAMMELTRGRIGTPQSTSRKLIYGKQTLSIISQWVTKDYDSQRKKAKA